jgi:multimeric flavodoxin WrbA/protein-tyrosine-phosphatase
MQMLVLGLHGSPRAKGNTHYLLQTFLARCEQAGAQTGLIAVPRLNLKPCIGCGHCEKKGFCVIGDDAMASDVYALLRQAEVIVVATPIYFYNATSQLKALIDRSQAFWSRKYVFKLADPAYRSRRGFLLSVGATKGANLFDGLKLTTRYFFDAINADFAGSLTYRQIESHDAMAAHPSAERDIAEAAQKLLAPLLERRRILFCGQTDACRSQMAAAFAHYVAGDRVEAASCGLNPDDRIDPLMEAVMQEKGIDVAFRKPRSVEQAFAGPPPQVIVNMGPEVAGTTPSAVQPLAWDVPAPADRSPAEMRSLRDDIEARVLALLETITPHG